MATLKSPTEITAPSRSEAASELAHTLSGSLEGLLAMGELLQQQPLAQAAQAQVQAIMDAGRRMSRLLGDVVELPGLTSPPTLEPTYLRDVLDDVEARWRSNGQGHGAQVLISCNAPADLRVMLDPPRLRRLLNTVIEGAFDASAWGVIELQLLARLDADGAVVIKGRLEAPGSEASVGSAALTLCTLIAGQMGGEFERTQGTGSGAITTFDLRLRQAGEDLAVEPDASSDEGPLPPRTHLLIVDDNATNRIVAAALCEMFGCTSETADDGVEAVEAAKQRPFDLILMDIKMPRMDGLEATKVIRGLGGQAGATPIVALTANAGAEAVATYLAGGMQAVVDKPIKPDQLLNTLQRVLCKEPEVAARHASAA